MQIMLIISRYLIVDYERYNFSISQRVWNADAKEGIRTILPPSNDTSHASSTKHVPIGTIVGATVGGAVVITLLIVLVLFYGKKRHSAQAYASLKPPCGNVTSPAISVFKPELDALGTSRMGPELEAGQIFQSSLSQVNMPLGPEQIHELPARETVGSELPGWTIKERPEVKTTKTREKQDTRKKQLVRNSGGG